MARSTSSRPMVPPLHEGAARPLVTLTHAICQTRVIQCLCRCLSEYIRSPVQLGAHVEIGDRYTAWKTALLRASELRPKCCTYSYNDAYIAIVEHCILLT